MFEEREEYAGDVLGNQNFRIVLFSMKYTKGTHQARGYLSIEIFSCILGSWWSKGCFCECLGNT